jgi:hypothetical protein
MAEAVTPDDIQLELLKLEHNMARTGFWNLHDRWKSGRLLIGLRSPVTNYLPKGRLTTVAATLKVSTRELSNRMRVAESFRTDAAFKNAARRFGSWSALVKSLPATRDARVEPRASRSKERRLYELLASILASQTFDGQKLYHARHLYDLLEEDEDLERR